MAKLKTVRDTEVKDRVILVRADYNVPLRAVAGDASNTIDDVSISLSTDGKKSSEQWIVDGDLRIRASLPTLQYLLDQGAARIVVMSHLGRPEGRDEKLSLCPVAEKLAELMPGVPISFVDQTTGPEVEAAVDDLPEGGILLLENLRFDSREEENSLEFAQEIMTSTHAALFVQDGFAVLHRAHASTDAITQILPSVAGFLVEKEVENLTKATDDPEHPFVVVIGGAKVEDKAPLIEKFQPLADTIYVGGKIAADGYSVEGKARAVAEKIKVATDFDADAEGVKLDIGPESMMALAQIISDAKTVLWNGVLGKVEDETYATSSTILARILGESDKTSIICGGDTASFAEKLCEENSDLHFSLISTGGGAALEFLLGNPMPGLAPLEEK